MQLEQHWACNRKELSANAFTRLTTVAFEAPWEGCLTHDHPSIFTFSSLGGSILGSINCLSGCSVVILTDRLDWYWADELTPTDVCDCLALLVSARLQISLD